MAKQRNSGRPSAPSSRRYSPEFKRDAVALFRSSGKAMAAVAKELGISDVTLAVWIREDEKRSGTAGASETEADRREAAALRKQIKDLEQEIEILKRFTAYWVKEGGK
jgi:transposase